MDESLREAACLGNLDAVKKLLQRGASISSQNAINGWTALHWACKRGHVMVAKYLMQSGADINIKTHKGELPADVTQSEDIRATISTDLELGSSVHVNGEKAPSDFCPNYLQHPVFPYSEVVVTTSQASLADATNVAKNMDTLSIHHPPTQVSPNTAHQHSNTAACLLQATDMPVSSCVTSACTSEAARSHSSNSLAMSESLSVSGPMLVKVRVVDSGEKDFIEVDLPALSYSALLNACCEEMEIQPSEIAKIRKLPNVWVRKDKDVQRMREGQELELVLRE